MQDRSPYKNPIPKAAYVLTPTAPIVIIFAQLSCSLFVGRYKYKHQLYIYLCQHTYLCVVRPYVGSRQSQLARINVSQLPYSPIPTLQTHLILEEYLRRYRQRTQSVGFISEASYNLCE